MSYLGNSPTEQAFVATVDYFNGNGSTVAFTLSRQVASVAQVQAVIENVPQNPSSAFTVSGNVITFTSAPPSGTANIYVYYTSPNTKVIAPSSGTVNTDALATGAVTTTKVADDAITNAKRTQGVQIFTSSGTFTVPNGVTKVKVTVVGGGGSGGSYNSTNGGCGGGGGGTAIKWISGLVPSTTVAVTIGAGGAGVSGISNGNAGGTSSFGAYCSATGGAAGSQSTGSATPAAGGTGSGGDINITGGRGGVTIQATNNPAGHGGNSIFGGGDGGGGGGSSGSTTNVAASTYGVGSVGGWTASSAGGDGVVIVEY